ncbi:MAG: MBL fold metallo-hydrolase [Tepidiformaceae bacterium]
MATVQRIALGYNNVYAVDDAGGRILIDTGPDYRGAREALGAALGEQRPDIVVATHGHLDHAGLGAYWQSLGVAVALGANDVHLAGRPQLSDGLEFEEFAAYVRNCGAPADVQNEVMAGLGVRRDWARKAATAEVYPSMGREHRWPSGLRYEPFSPHRVIGDGEGVGCGLQVELCPGHTPGNLVVATPAEGWLFSGDQLLPEITPTPAIQARAPEDLPGDWRLRSLPEFYHSLQRLAGASFSRCFPGHGEPFDDVAGVIAANIAQIEQRGERVAEQLSALGSATLYSLCEALYPRALRRRFWQIVATVQGHCDLLEEDGRVLAVDGCYELSM